MVRPHRILMGVTVSLSLVHHEGLPARLVDLGWDVTVVTSPGPELESLMASGVRVVPIKMARDPSPLSDLRSLVTWVKVLRHVRPDVIVVGTPKASLLGLTAARLLGVRHRVYVLHGLRLETTSGWFRRLLLGLERMTSRSASHVVAVSDSLRDKAVDLGIVAPTRIRVLGEGSINGVASPAELAYDTSAASRHERRANTPLIGYVGRINPDKGFGDFTRALSFLADQGTTVRSRVVGAPEGDGGMALLKAYQSLDGQHEYRGPAHDVSPHYAEMDVLCLPSYREGLGMVVLEAAGWGVPAVVSDATGVRDSIVDGVTGYRYPAGDVSALAEKLTALAQDSTARQRMGAAARARVLCDFNRDTVQEHLIGLFDEMVAQ